MNIRRVLAVAAIPFVIGTFSFVAPSQAEAAYPPNRIAQYPQQRYRPHNRRWNPDSRPQIKRHPRPRVYNQNRRPPLPPGARRVVPPFVNR